MVYNVVAQTLGGTVRCTSELGAGTTFMVAFPVEHERRDVEATPGSLDNAQAIRRAS